jgi:outer membrane protein
MFRDTLFREMKGLLRILAAVFLLGFGTANSMAQKAPAAPDSLWQASKKMKLNAQLPSVPTQGYAVSAQTVYSLADLINLAEQHNPETRLAWQQARARAAELGIARSEWCPTIAALAVADTARVRVLLNSTFYRQTYGNFTPELHAEYLVLDFGGRSGAIDTARWNLLAADLSFNDTHRRIIFQVMSAYYRLLDARGLRQAAEVSLRNAQAVEADVQDRLNHGLATKPDLLEAEASSAQAEYDLQNTIGAEQIAHGNLATVLELPPDTDFQVQEVSALDLPTDLADSVRAETQRALEQRPDLKALLAQVKAANAVIREQRSSYFPTLSFDGDGGLARQYGAQDQLPPGYTSGETWDATLELKWTLFDGGRREHRVGQALAQRAAAQAQIDSLRDQIANGVWAAHTDVETALRQTQAALSLMTSAEQSYEATRESYNYGVRNILDVIAAQKALAQAQAEDVTARTQLLLQTANLAFQTGDLIASPPAKTGP